MSTRSVIARQTPNGFSGVYHHWDGYPSGLGKTLFELWNGHFKRDTAAMLKYLIDDNPAGWSTINGADFSIPAGPRPDENLLFCKTCYRPYWAHYKQYYNSHNPEWIKAGKPPVPSDVPADVYKLFPCNGESFEQPHGPECFGRDAALVTHKTAAACGCEWAYAFDGNGSMTILSSYCDPKGPHGGQKMIGAFGMGDPDSIWKAVAIVNLAGDEPDWDKIG